MQDLQFLRSVVPHRVAGPPQCPAAHTAGQLPNFSFGGLYVGFARIAISNELSDT
jgi:hypothetical protein